uniref:GOST seven transmembrane domain-containing protein n=2 Tax=Phaeomonas parva TaxID=124430 RepID=A0A7S1XSC9_9STRA|mmetsp:Transcript_32810/g.103872  ORF Transcript_32810/g.103872 Transcript_32810/m.103872 type:complete len:231 (+) Transcript_32810:143-835(+)
MYFGEIPFEFVRFLFLVVFVGLFGAFMRRQQAHLLGLHWAVLAVLVIEAIEAMFWFATYAGMNTSGDPECCPFPPAYGAAVTFEVLRQAASRTVLVLLSLGLWVVRDRIEGQELWSVVGISLSFLIVGIGYHATEMEMAKTKSLQELTEAEQNDSNLWELPWSFLNVLFVGWIFHELTGMMNELKSRGQTYKLSMYINLGRAFVGILVLWTVVFLVSFFVWTGAFRLSQA